MKYAQYFQAKKGMHGQLWKARFLSCMLDDRSVYEEVRFIENNPVRSGLVERAEEYPWSSARYHILGEADPVILGDCPLKDRVCNWRDYLADRGDEPVLKRTRQSLKRGRPAGDKEFIRGLEKIVGRRLMAMPRGRPRKNRAC
jgi:putative transposase